MMAHMASGEPGRIGRAAPEGPVPDYEPPPPMSDEERRRGKEWIEKIRRDNEGVLNPMNVADSAAAASRRFREGFERVEAVIARGDDRLDATAERWRERLRGRRAPGAEDVNPQSQMSGGAWKALLSGKLPPILSEPGPLAPAEPPGQGIEELEAMLEPGDPESTMSSIWGAIMDIVPDIDPKTAIMVASAVAALLAAGTGVGGPLAPVILGGGAALASQ